MVAYFIWDQKWLINRQGKTIISNFSVDEKENSRRSSYEETTKDTDHERDSNNSNSKSTSSSRSSQKMDSDLNCTGYTHLKDSDSDSIPPPIDEQHPHKPRIVGAILKKDVLRKTRKKVPRIVFLRQSLSDSKLKKDSYSFSVKRSCSDRRFNDDNVHLTREDLSLDSVVDRCLGSSKTDKSKMAASSASSAATRGREDMVVKWNYKHRWKIARRKRETITTIVRHRKSNGGNEQPSMIPYSRSPLARNHPARTSSMISRNSSRHGRIIRLEQKATQVLGVVFFTFVILWAPFFVLNLLPTICEECEKDIPGGVFDFVTWLGYASSMVNPIFYTIFNKVFRDAFKKVLTCRYRRWEVPGQYNSHVWPLYRQPTCTPV